MTKKKQAELLRSARIANDHGISKVTGSPFVSTIDNGAGFTDLRNVINPGKIPWYANPNTKAFYNFRGIRAALQEALEYAVQATGIPKDEWETSPFDRTTMFPRSAITAALGYAEEKTAGSPK